MRRPEANVNKKSDGFTGWKSLAGWRSLQLTVSVTVHPWWPSKVGGTRSAPWCACRSIWCAAKPVQPRHDEHGVCYQVVTMVSLSITTSLPQTPLEDLVGSEQTAYPSRSQPLAQTGSRVAANNDNTYALQ